MAISPHRRLLLAIFLAALAPATTCAAVVRPQRTVIYVNDTDPRVANALAVLRAALEKSGVASRYDIRIEHLVVDMWQPAAIEARLKVALQANPAAIIAPNSEIAMIAKSLTTQIPIIFASHQDPIRMGLIDSLARPGKNLTGFTFFVPVDEKRLELLRQIAPRAKNLGIVIDRWWLEQSGGREAARRAQLDLGFEPHFFAAETIEELKKALSGPEAGSMDAWYVPFTALAYYEMGPVVEVFAPLRKPVMFPATPFVEKGGLIAYQQLITLEDSASIWGTMIGLVLDGLPPGEIPIERPKSFELALNVEAARRLGLAIPASLIKRADKVFDAAPALAARQR